MADIGPVTKCMHTEPSVDQGHSKSQSNIAGASVLTASAISLAACGGGGSSGTQSAAPVGTPVAAPSPSPAPTPTDDRAFSTADAAAARFLLRASLSASPDEIASIKVEGQSAWLDRKMSEKNSETAAEFFRKNGFDAVDSKRWFAREQLVDQMIWSQLVDGSNGVRKRVALALSNFFVISANRLSMQWPAQAIGAFWDLLNDHAFGNFKTLLREVCLSPAMGEFLDVIGSKKADPNTGRNPDENFARELLQLFSIGLFELNQDGTIKLQNGDPIETYDNSDVAGLARVFTGYNVDNSGLPVASDPQPPNKDVAGVESVRRPMTADPRRWLRPQSGSEHSDQEKRFLGMRIPAGTGPTASLEMTIDGLFNHPNVAPFFCKQMIQRLVTSNPSSSYVLRVARVFADNGRGERGDLRAVFKAILLDEEASSAAGLSDPRFGKLREPVLRFSQFARTFRISSQGGLGITRNLANPGLLGQAPLRPPSVFNFFSPTFVPGRSAALENGIVAPEFQLVNEISVADYLNFLEFTIDGRGFWLNDWQPEYAREEAMASSPRDLIDHLDLVLLASQIQPASRNKVIEVVESISSDNPRERVQTAILLIMASTDYLIQK